MNECYDFSYNFVVSAVTTEHLIVNAYGTRHYQVKNFVNQL